MVDFQGGSAIRPTFNEGLEIEHSNFAGERAMVKGDTLWQVVEIVIGGVLNIHEIH